MTCNNVRCCYNTRRFSLPTALVNVNMVAYGKINTRLSPPGEEPQREREREGGEIYEGTGMGLGILGGHRKGETTLAKINQRPGIK